MRFGMEYFSTVFILTAVLACSSFDVFREIETARPRKGPRVAGGSRDQEAYRLGVDDDDSTTGSREGEIRPMLPYRDSTPCVHRGMTRKARF